MRAAATEAAVACPRRQGGGINSCGEIASYMRCYSWFTKGGGGALYLFRDGHYQPCGEDYIREEASRLIHAFAPKAWSRAILAEIAEFIRIDSPTLWDSPPDHMVNVANGMLDIGLPRGVETWQELRAQQERGWGSVWPRLEPHCPEMLTATKLPVWFDPNAKCPAVERFVRQVLPADSVGLTWELAADLLSPSRDIQRAVLAVGEGANGKSTWLALLRAFVGAENCSALSLHDLAGSRFASYSLLGKRLNVCADLPSSHLGDTGLFKAITGGDPVRAELKFGRAFEFTPRCRLVFSANTLPRSNDASDGFFRRFLVVPFPNSFAGAAAVPQGVVLADLTRSEELSGLLNRGLEALPALRLRGDFTQSESMRAAAEEFRAETDSLEVFLAHHTTEGPGLMLPKLDLVRALRRYTDDRGLPPVAETTLAKRLRAKGWGDAQRRVAGKVTRVWLGHGLIDAAHAEMPPGTREAV